MTAQFFKRSFFALIIFSLGAVCAFFLNMRFHRWLREMYVYFSDGRISFFGGKEFFLLDVTFIICAGSYITALTILLFYLGRMRKVILHLLISISICIFSIGFICWLDSNLKLVQCTACNDGTRKLHWGDIPYNNIFATGVLISLLPLLISILRQRLLKKK